MRDALTFNAKSAIDRATDRMTRSGGAHTAWNSGESQSDDLVRHVRAAYLLGKRSIADSAATDNHPNRTTTTSTAASSSARTSACNANAGASSTAMTDLTEIDAYINNLMGTSYLTHRADDESRTHSTPQR